MAKKNKDRQIVFRCPAEIVEQLQKVAASLGLGMSGYIRMAVIEDMKRRDKEDDDKKRNQK